MQKVLLLILLFPVLSASAQKIEGTVYDHEGNVLPFASVLIKGTPQGVSANKEGKFSIGLQPGNYVLVCHYVGYTTQEKTIVLGSTNVNLNFKLSPQKLTLKEIIINFL